MIERSGANDVRIARERNNPDAIIGPAGQSMLATGDEQPDGVLHGVEARDRFVAAFVIRRSHAVAIVDDQLDRDAFCMRVGARISALGPSEGDDEQEHGSPAQPGEYSWPPGSPTAPDYRLGAHGRESRCAPMAGP